MRYGNRHDRQGHPKKYNAVKKWPGVPAKALRCGRRTREEICQQNAESTEVHLLKGAGTIGILRGNFCKPVRIRRRRYPEIIE
jgi:hypothetical protein